MEKVEALKQEKVLSKANTIAFAKFAVLLALATLLPFVKQQLFVGSCVNAILFLSAAWLGPQAAIMVGLVPSLVSISVGLLPAVIAPAIPFIMVSNSILIMTFAGLRKKNQWAGMIAASVLKFAFLYSSTSLIVGLLLKPQAASTIKLMMGPVQLITALIGGVIASLILAGVNAKKSK